MYLPKERKRMAKPKVLILDCETLPNICYAFDLYSYKNPQMLIKEKAIITFAYKWLGEKESYVIVADAPYDDKNLCEKINEIIGQADYAIAHFGDKFDFRFIRSRCLFHGIKPTPVVPQIDTYKLAKKYFHLNANKLDYLGTYLKVGRKHHTTFKLWADCANGKKSAIKEMAAYNKQDVLLLEKVFLAMLPHVESKINHNLFSDNEKVVCDNCGSHRIQKRGFLVSKVLRRQRYNCKKCGAWFSKRLLKGE